jgi:hypothetical protein
MPEDAVGNFCLNDQALGFKVLDRGPVKCLDIAVNLMRIFFDPVTGYAPHVPHIRSLFVDKYAMQLWWPDLQEHEVECLDEKKQLASPDEALYEIEGRTENAPKVGFCLPVDKLLRLKKEQKLADSKSGSYGVSTRIRVRRPTQADEKSSVVRIKQALLDSCTSAGPLLDLMWEGWVGLRCVNAVMDADPALVLCVCLCWSVCGLAAQAARARVRRRRLTRRLGAFDACAARLVQGGGPAESTTTILCRLCAAVGGVQVAAAADVQG